MEGKGKIYDNKGVKVFVASPGGGNCPRLGVRARHATLRDDYSGDIKTKKSIMQLIF
jgi:hypothetical protein